MENKNIAIIALLIICCLCIYYKIENGAVISIITAIAGLADGADSIKKFKEKMKATNSDTDNKK